MLDVAEAMNSEHAAQNDLLRPTTVDGQEVRVVASPVQWHLDTEGGVTAPLPPLASPPDIGEQSADILREFGLDLDPEDIRR
ncbi:hypothetical protein [Microbacterium sp. NIBRBAC000506063]|uniref:hypothetical protein n=1 Tax=Microbacterium sp. NIBRBAC000506063 TaxID=2734618 RepID=UPI001BB5D702|nr:hypothetical protein [Microbacterium sp. NIBRBAC000506063]QTV80475.1 hypothetical protein KAE78_06100 [Microbacterium sp. NIBRBAC000506063]